MVRVISVIGKLAYIFGYPIIFLVLNNSHRTRVIIEYGGEILVVKHTLSMGKWGLPGGGLKRHESSKIAAKREILEELSIDLSNYHLEEVNSMRVKQGLANLKLDVYYVRLRSKPKINKQIHEIREIAWVEVDNVYGLNMNETDRNIVSRTL